MQAKEVMSSNMRMIPSNTSIQAAAGLMRDMDIGILPVTEDGQIVGMLSDRDIAVRAVAEGADPAATPAREIMSREIVSCYADQDAGEVVNVMAQKRIRRVVVVDRNNEAIGVISVDDLALHSGTRPLVDDVIQKFSHH